MTLLIFCRATKQYGIHKSVDKSEKWTREKKEEERKEERRGDNVMEQIFLLVISDLDILISD